MPQVSPLLSTFCLVLIGDSSLMQSPRLRVHNHSFRPLTITLSYQSWNHQLDKILLPCLQHLKTRSWSYYDLHINSCIQLLYVHPAPSYTHDGVPFGTICCDTHDNGTFGTNHLWKTFQESAWFARWHTWVLLLSLLIRSKYIQSRLCTTIGEGHAWIAHKIPIPFQWNDTDSIVGTNRIIIH